MKIRIVAFCIVLVACSAIIVRAQSVTAAQSPPEQPVSLAQKAVALDAAGREALSASLVTNALQGTPEAPIKNVRFIVENRGALLYTYVSGIITFYKEGAVRCGEGLFTLNALAPAEAAEVDAPGLRLECAPSSWRIVATNLMTRANDAASPVNEVPVPPAPPVPPVSPLSPLYLTIEGRRYQVPLNSTLEIPVTKKRIKITLTDQP